MNLNACYSKLNSLYLAIVDGTKKTRDTKLGSKGLHISEYHCPILYKLLIMVVAKKLKDEKINNKKQKMTKLKIFFVCFKLVTPVCRHHCSWFAIGV